jgi:hypothetical protein
MKRIGTIKGVPVVEGNINEVTKNQIHYKENGGGIQLSKRDNENKLNSITSGSSNGDGGGVKEYYYKVIDEQVYDAIKDLPFILISGVIIDMGFEYIYTPYLPDGKFIAFKTVDIEMTYWGYTNDNKVDRGIILKGDLYERMTLGLTANGETISIEDVKNQFGTIIQEITKEEYESMITYKPE